MYKIFRLGHRNYRGGVITVASRVDMETQKIYYGTSFCSPKETKYYKSMGNEWAVINLEEKIARDEFIKLNEPKHSDIIRTILYQVLRDPNLPRWAPELISKQLDYPIGLHRYENKKLQEIVIEEIVVNSEYAKEQLLLALEYMSFVRELDHGYYAVDELTNLHCNPELITVNS